MKILITGASGFLGRRAAIYFSELGYNVCSPSRSELDITDRAAVEQWFQRNRPQAVLHCAAISNTGACQQDPEHTAIINVRGSENIARTCSQTGAKLIFCSSDQVYAGSPLPGPHSETEPLTPGNVYAGQKLMAEQLCMASCPNTVCLRLSWMYSTQFLPGDHSHLLTLLRELLQDDHRSMTRSPHDFRGVTNVASVVRNLPAALELPAGIYNFGSESEMDMYHTLYDLFDELDLQNVISRLHPDKQMSPRDIRMDTTLAASYGIRFESTREGLYQALSNFI